MSNPGSSNSPTPALTFHYAPAGPATIRVSGTSTRVLEELQKLVRDTTGKVKPGYIDMKPSTVFSGSGGELTSYISEAHAWEPLDYIDNNGDPKEGIKTVVDKDELKVNALKPWVKPSILGFIVGFFKGSLYNSDTAITDVVDKNPFPYFNIDGPPSTTVEHITAISRVYDNATITVTNLAKDDPKSVFYSHNNDPLTSTYIKNKINNYIAYAPPVPPLDAGEKVRADYLALRKKRSKFVLQATSRIPLVFPSVKPDPDIQSPHSGVTPLQNTTRLAVSQMRDQALSDDYYDDAGTTTQTSYSLLVDIFQTFQSKANIFYFSRDDTPTGLQSGNLYTNALYALDQVLNNYREERAIRNIITDNGRYYLGPEVTFEYKDGVLVLDTTPEKNGFLYIANKMTESRLSNEEWVVFIRCKGLKDVQLTGDTSKNIRDSFYSGYDNFSVTIVTRGAQKQFN